MCSIEKDKLVTIFNTWAKEYAEHPEKFTTSCLDENGKPLLDYGEACAAYFTTLHNTLDPEVSSRTSETK